MLDPNCFISEITKNEGEWILMEIIETAYQSRAMDMFTGEEKPLVWKGSTAFPKAMLGQQ